MLGHGILKLCMVCLKFAGIDWKRIGVITVVMLFIVMTVILFETQHRPSFTGPSANSPILTTDNNPAPLNNTFNPVSYGADSAGSKDSSVSIANTKL
jgi:hypothetical protein